MTHLALVGMAPRLSADMAVLHIKLVAAHASVVDLPRFGITYSLSLAKWAHVCVSFYCLPDLAFRHVKSVAAHASVVDSPRFGVTHNLCVAEGHMYV